MKTRMTFLAPTALAVLFAFTNPVSAQGMGGPGSGHMFDSDSMCQDSLTSITVTGTIFTELILVDPDSDSSFAGPGGHQGPGMGGPGMCDSLGFGHWDSTFFDGFGGYHQGSEWGGMQNHMNRWRHQENDTADAAYRERVEGPDSLVYHEIFFLDVDGDSTMDYVLNFGPAWYQPVDTNLVRPADGDTVTITGFQMMTSPQWDVDVLVVTELDGGIWREFGFQGPGGPPHATMMQAKNQVIGENSNFPNPFNPTTTISYNILDAGHVTITIYDITGRMVRTLVANRYQAPGIYRVVWNGTDMSGASVASGLYLYSISAGGERVNRLITYLK